MTTKHQQNGRVAVVLDVGFTLPITFPSPLWGCVTVRPLGYWIAGVLGQGERLLFSALERSRPGVADGPENSDLASQRVLSFFSTKSPEKVRTSRHLHPSSAAKLIRGHVLPLLLGCQ